MKKLLLLCFCLIVGLLLLTRSPKRADKSIPLSAMLPLLDANDSKWELMELHDFGGASQSFWFDEIDQRKGWGEMKSGSIEDMGWEGFNRKNQQRLRQLLVLMRQTKIVRIRRWNAEYMFYEDGGRLMNRGEVYIYTKDAKKWNPKSYRGEWFKGRHKFHQINEHWHRAEP